MTMDRLICSCSFQQAKFIREQMINSPLTPDHLLWVKNTNPCWGKANYGGTVVTWRVYSLSVFENTSETPILVSPSESPCLTTGFKPPPTLCTCHAWAPPSFLFISIISWNCIMTYLECYIVYNLYWLFLPNDTSSIGTTVSQAPLHHGPQVPGSRKVLSACLWNKRTASGRTGPAATCFRPHPFPPRDTSYTASRAMGEPLSFAQIRSVTLWASACVLPNWVPPS